MARSKNASTQQQQSPQVSAPAPADVRLLNRTEGIRVLTLRRFGGEGERKKNPDGTRRLVTKTIVLLPGLNKKIAAEDFAAIERLELFQKWESRGDVEVIANGIVRLSARDRLLIAKTTADAEVIEQWLENEDDPKVRKALEVALDEVTRDAEDRPVGDRPVKRHGKDERRAHAAA